MGRPPARRLGKVQDRDDSGFTLMETVVSLFVVAVVLLGLVYIQSAATLATAQAKQRQQATQLANRVMEQARAIPWVTLLAGLNSDDLGSDTNISSGRFRPTYTTGVDEELITSATQDQPPLYPHQQQVTLGNATYSVRVYVSKPTTWTASNPILWLTAVTSRVSGPGSAFRPVGLRTQVFSPRGCLSTGTRPYAGPCQAFFYGTAGTTSGRIWLDQNGSDAVPDARSPAGAADDARRVGVRPGGADHLGELLGHHVGGEPEGEQRRHRGGPGAGEGLGGRRSLVQPADQPRTGDRRAAGGSGAVDRELRGGDAHPLRDRDGRCDGRENSGGAVPCRDTGDQLTSTGLPCASAKLSSLGLQTVTVDPSPLAGRSLGSFTLAGLDAPAPSPGPGRAWVARLAQAQNGHCTALTSPGTVGCSTTGAVREAGTLTLGGVPAINGADTVGWASGAAFTGMVTVTGYSASASSEQGIGAGAPGGARAGSVSYWNGSGYSTFALSGSAVNQSLGTAEITYKAGASNITMTLGGTVTAAAVSTTPWPTPNCQDAACVTAAQVPSVVVRVTYSVQMDGVPVGTFAVNANLGTVMASTSYKAAPSA